ncbi:PAS domain-containing sensor histidine kinase [Maricaulis sp. CAU 1757]
MPERRITQLEELFRHLPLAAVILEESGRVLETNPAARFLFHESAKAFDESTLADICQSAGEAAELLAKARDLSGPRQHHQRVRFRSSTGRTFIGEAALARLSPGDGGGPILLTVRDVSREMELQAQLEAREMQLSATLASANEGTFSINLETGLGAARGFINSFMGLPQTEATFTLDRLVEVLHADMRSEFRHAIDHLRRKPTDALDLIVKARRKDEEWRWLQLRGKVSQFDSDGHPLRLNGKVVDITELRQLEARIVESDMRLREALESANDGAWSLDLERDWLTLSGFPAQRLGFGSNEIDISFDEWLDHAPPDDRARARAVADRLKAAQRGSDPDLLNALFGDFPMRQPDGTDVWVRTRGRIVEWTEDGRPRRLAGTMSNITEEHRLKSALEDSERLLRETLLAVGEGTWRVEIGSGIVEASEVIARMMGLPASNIRIAVADWLDRVDPAERDEVQAAFDAVRNQERDSIDMTVRFDHAFEGWRRYHVRGGISDRDPAGRPRTISGFVTDITERLETQERLAARERQLAEAVDAAAMGTWRIDIPSDRLFLRGTVVAELFSDLTEIELSARDWFKKVHPDDMAELTATNLSILRGDREGSDISCRLRARDGSWRWYRVTGRVVRRDEAGRALRSSGVMWDIDPAKRFEDAMQVQRQRFEHIYRATPAMMHSIDAEGRIIEVSDYWLNYLGYDRSEVIGRRSVEFLDDESRERAVKVQLPHLFEKGFNNNVPYRFRHKDGHLIDVLLSSFLERDSDGNPLFSYAVMTDVTALHRVNRQLERSNRELDRFATVASHDLQEPLRKISAFSGLIRRRYADQLDADGVRSLDFLVDAAARMQRLVEDLLVYSRQANQELKLETLDLNAVIDDVRESLESAINESGARIDSAGLPQVEADRTLLTQAFQNLVSNAVKYRGPATPHIRIEAVDTGDSWQFSVADNGIGFDMRFKDKIFAPFQRLHTREEYRGTGIGLAIMHQAAERMGGRVWVESEPGRGSTFYFSISKALSHGTA